MQNVIIPSVSNKFYTDTEAPQVKEKMTAIYNSFKGIIDSVSSISNIPKELLKSFIFIESTSTEMSCRFVLESSILSLKLTLLPSMIASV